MRGPASDRSICCAIVVAEKTGSDGSMASSSRCMLRTSARALPDARATSVRPPLAIVGSAAWSTGRKKICRTGSVRSLPRSFVPVSATTPTT
jgi:hypothetical protein